MIVEWVEVLTKERIVMKKISQRQNGSKGYLGLGKYWCNKKCVWANWVWSELAIAKNELAKVIVIS